MAVADVHNTDGEKVSQVELSDLIFNVPVKKSVLHEVVTMQLAGKRAGTAAVKRRSDVKGSGAKLFRQKGMGRARRGDIKSPLLRGGGVIFGPSPRSYAQRTPKKVRALAMKMALTCKLEEKKLLVIDQMKLDRVKTKDFADILDRLGAKNSLLVSDGRDEKLDLSSRNVPGTKVIETAGLNVYDILKYDTLILVEPAIKQIEGRLIR
ncbi:50S ribosomal protein L4 [Candidatus Desulfarcum epimagneticum]|uniref:Large ribosomal subunit protein uL4 n=1 Tax=uncultured Desulfobacteraceae bacterium TaxID=218296 RepID=A0A484HK31_9BACT|nr:50S ribosomal protein L4 [uncultured Desulfobacteraceae bacterium]